MAYYAFLDANNIVTEVIPGKNETDLSHDWEQYYGNVRGQVCKRTSYNTRGGVHLFGGSPFRKNYAGTGFYFDSARDAFIPPKPFVSWVLNEAECLWYAPIQEPNDGKFYQWNEPTLAWVEILP